MTAQTFKDTIERTLKPQLQSGFAADLADIVGAGAYMAGKATHIAGVTAHGDTLTVRLVAPAPDFPSRIAETGFCSVPTNAPLDTNGVQPVPSAGPYYVASYTPNHTVVLNRNPNYRGSRPHHFARIQLTVGVSDERAVAEIEAGTADYTGSDRRRPPRSTGSPRTRRAVRARQPRRRARQTAVLHQSGPLNSTRSS